MTLENAVQDVVLDLNSFQLIRAGRPVKLEKSPMELLTLLVRRRGALVSREEIVRTIWGDAVHVDVDAGINTAIRKIRLALDDNSEFPGYLETSVGKGYRFVGPITVINAAVVPDLAAPQTAPAHRRRSGRWIGAGLAVAGLAAVLLLAISAMHRNTAAAAGDHQGRQIIAFVPLQNLSQDPGQDYFVDGLTDEIMTQLGQLNPERLVVMKYRSLATRQLTRSTIADLGQRSGLQYLLEGSVRRQHEQARISIRLVRVADQTTLWTDSFDRQVGDVLSLQSEIAQRIGRELQIQVLGRTNRKPAKPDALEAYLHGRFEMSVRRVETDSAHPPDAARGYFERAIVLDPSFAPAYAGLSDFYRRRAVSNDGGSEQAWRLAEEYATKALSLDGDSEETHTSIAYIKLVRDWDWQAAREHALRALQLNPSSPEAHAVYAHYLRIACNTGEAASHSKQALALDPFRADLAEQLIFAYYFARDYQSGVAAARQVLARDPNNQFVPSALCVALGRLRLFDESVAECSKALALEGHNDWIPPYLREYRQRGYEAADLLVQKKYLDETLKLPRPDLWNLANAYVLAGKREEGLRTLFQGLPTHEPGLLQIRVDPDFDSIRNDPRYAELVRRIGFPTE